MYSEKTPDDGRRNCPKHVEFRAKNKFVKLVHLVGFIKKEVKVFRNRLGVAQRVPGGLGSQISMTFGT